MWKKKLPPIPEPPTSPVEYPSGIAVWTADEGEVKYYFINKDHKRYRIPTVNMLISWSFPFIVQSTTQALKNYPVAYSKVMFRDGTLLNNFADGKLYLVSESKLRHVVSPEVLERLGVPRDRAMVVSGPEIDMMDKGDAIT